ncbi:MAG: phosphoribosylamine--glycine ligase [Candidatus Omnitrophica bacterium]|nr:phosphoribosylamine--glycine ligase [Candidatus Omnitrophota bacterium]MBU4479012.1 phosphoribosylamine--glycine ligase [Candidatus Omnitrophota bacterium]MCG2703807.1 phosphoribosylamine--glycine ligase [Candidatus Omnitrophota bacterium]
MKVLVIGSGGREHALVWKIAQSPLVKRVYCAPGNAGISELAEIVPIAADDITGLADFSEREKIDLTVVGPEAPLALGIVDLFRSKNMKIFGPGKSASRLESSKVFAKNIMKKYGVPTADFRVFLDKDKTLDFVRKAQRPLVIKADGLCAGKGVFVCATLEEQENAIIAIMQEGVFGAAGRTVLIEERLEGEEASIIVVSDGEHVLALASSQDYKRIFDFDRGPNTGGMGAYSPAPLVTQEMFAGIERKIIIPMIQGMKQEGAPFCGVLYAGVMIDAEGPKVLEFNVRLGDPETQAILPRLKSDIVEMMLKALDKGLSKATVEWDERACVCVVVAAGGYPGAYEKGKEIVGLPELKDREDVVVFHAGTKKLKTQNSKFITVTNGGRVLGVTALGDSIQAAIGTVYSALEKINFEAMYYRKDIGKRALPRVVPS